MKKTVLKKYAHLLAAVGINVKKGQEVIIKAELDQPEFVRMLTAECYRLGARRVTVDFSDQRIDRLHAKHRTLTTLSELPSYELEKWRYRAEHLPSMIYLLSEDPDGMSDLDQAKIAKASRARMKHIKPLRDRMENKYPWCIAAVPGEAWAKKVFPDLKKNAAIERLWEAILHTSRCTDDPVAAWAAHNENLARRCAYLNGLAIRSLHYTSKNGTDLTVGMMPEGLFLAGGEYTLDGHFFNPNIPSEEVFSTPKRGEAEGIVYATRPLSYNGQLIENFSVRFEGGKAVEIHAEKNEALLREMIGMDEGAAYLGEVALVPYASPINDCGILFYNTLFDENAVCHLALGRGFHNCVRDYETRSFEENTALGVNDSIIHEDFMIGADDLSIVAQCENGQRIEIFKDGNWSF
ncbi:MAG: aminopeptidase [Clostridia bacterium]|nr:aminopeptidase [Clostridia bacterium]